MGYIEKVISLLSLQVFPARGQYPYFCLYSAGTNCLELTGEPGSPTQMGEGQRVAGVLQVQPPSPWPL